MSCTAFHIKNEEISLPTPGLFVILCCKTKGGQRCNRNSGIPILGRMVKMITHADGCKCNGNLQLENGPRTGLTSEPKNTHLKEAMLFASFFVL